MAATLKLTDGTTEIELTNNSILKNSGLYLNNIRPQIAQYKGGGTYRSSPFADGRRLVDTKYENVIETFELKARQLGQDVMALTMQEIRRLLVKAAEYWTTTWQNEPVWLEARASKETNTRYAIVVNGTIPDDENYWNQPFLQPLRTTVMDNLTMIIERQHWLATQPGTGTATLISAVEPYTAGDVLALPGESADDADADDFLSTVDLVGALDFGFDANDVIHAGVRFRNVFINQGASITAAKITFTPSSSLAGNMTGMILRGEDVDNAAVFTSSYATFISRMGNSTTATTTWNIIANWTVDVEEDTPDFAATIQEIVGRSGWVFGNSLAIFVDNFAMADLNNRIAYSFDTSTSKRPRLVVEVA